MAIFKKKLLVNWGLIAVIILSAYLSLKMVKSLKESYEGVYPDMSGAYAAPDVYEGYAELNEDEGYAELEDTEGYAELEEEETFAALDEIPEGSTVWGDGTQIAATARPSETFTTLLVEPAYGKEANALFTPSI